MELREIEVFLTLTEELHFGRTAERMHLTPARVSQLIKKIERQIGAPLFERSSRHVSLTPLGEKLRDDLSAAHAAVQRSLEDARRTASGEPDVLRLGMIGWNFEDLRPFTEAYLARRQRCDIQVRSISLNDPFAQLRSGQLDAALLWLPVREPDLTVGPLVYTEPIVLAMAANDPLAAEESLSYEVLAERTAVTGPKPEYWAEAIMPARTPSGRPIRTGPVVTDFRQTIPILATGEAVSPVHAHVVQFAPPGIVYRPIYDAPQASWALVWSGTRPTDAVRTLADVIATHGPLEL